MEIIKTLKNPPNAYRGKPFWSWNGELEESELLRQIDCMHDMGFGGFFMHSRTGLITEYLGDEWFRLVRVCAEYAYNKYGMEAWLYDEDRWPSGTCGGMVTKDRKNRLRFLSLYDGDEQAIACKEVAGILYRYAVRLETDESGEQRLADCYAVESESEVKEGYRYAVFAEEEQQCSDFYNGFTYIDAMNREVTELFIESTHEKYYKKCGDLFGTAIKGIFTDEPHRGCVFNGFGISNENRDRMTPYTAQLPASYARKYGRELCVPEIYWRKKDSDYNKTAAEYIDVLDDLFTQNFAKPCKDWCNEHGIMITGHILHEDSLSIQASLTGSCMRYYEYMDYPGIDVLTEENNIYWAAVQCSSVARQLGKKFVLSELYGATGWNMTLQRYKTCADWQAFFGINFRCPHLSWYTMQGEAKRDYPASILHQNAWYKDWKALEDYFSRLGVLSAEGKKLCDVLYVAPMREAWGCARLGWMETLCAKDQNAARLDKEYFDDFRRLFESGINFDYGDEEIIRKYGSVEKENGITYLRVGKVRYDKVFWNSAYDICKETRELIERYKSEGGFVTRDTEAISSAWRFQTPKGVAVTAYEFGGDIWAYVLNTDKQSSATGEIVIPDSLDGYNAEIWDFRVGERVGKAETAKRGKRNGLAVNLFGGQELIVRFTRGVTASVEKGKKSEKAALPKEFAYELTEPNVLPLDEVVWEKDGQIQNGGKPCNVLHVDRKIRADCGKMLRGGEMLQPWFVKKYGESGDEQKLCNLSLAYTFNAETVPADTVYLAKEKTLLSVTVNGEPLGKASDLFWADKCFTLYPIALKKGENKIVMSGEFAESDGLEAIYILGNFGVTLPATLTRLPASLTAGDISEQGLPYYSGSVKYHTGITEGNVRIAFSDLKCAVMRIHGGKEMQTLAFAPYETTVSLCSELILETVFNRRNTFGPLHQTMPQSCCAPDSFLTDGKDYVPFTPLYQGLL